MRKLRIILFFVFLLASLIGVYYVLVGGVRTYSVRQEKFNLSYDIDKQEGTIVDKVVSFSNNNKLLEAVANKDTAKLSAYTCEIIDRYKVDEVAVVDNIGAVTNHCLLNSRNNYAWRGGLLRGRSLYSIGDSDEAKSCKVMNTAHHGACRECREKTALGSRELGRGQEGHWTGR